MSLLNTKPNWFRGECIATERGWVNPQNNEVLVAIGNLKSKLEAEISKNEIVLSVENIIVQKEEDEHLVLSIKEEIKVEQKIKQPKPKTQKQKVIGESTDHKIKNGQQLIGEVVEYDLEKNIVSE